MNMEINTTTDLDNYRIQELEKCGYELGKEQSYSWQLKEGWVSSQDSMDIVERFVRERSEFMFKLKILNNDKRWVVGRSNYMNSGKRDGYVKILVLVKKHKNICIRLSLHYCFQFFGFINYNKSSTTYCFLFVKSIQYFCFNV